MVMDVMMFLRVVAPGNRVGCESQPRSRLGDPNSTRSRTRADIGVPLDLTTIRCARAATDAGVRRGPSREGVHSSSGLRGIKERNEPVSRSPSAVSAPSTVESCVCHHPPRRRIAPDSVNELPVEVDQSKRVARNLFLDQENRPIPGPAKKIR